MKVVGSFTPLLILPLLVFAGCQCHYPPAPSAPKKPVIKVGNPSILGKGRSTERMMFAYFSRYNPKLTPAKLTYIIRTYIWESKCEGVNHDIAFIQMCHETNFLKFGGAISPGQNNFCSLGTMGYDVYGACFFSLRDGIRAHVQHLKAYGSRISLENTCIDPRFDLIERGCAKTLLDLTSKWSPAGDYGKALQSKIGELLMM